MLRRMWLLFEICLIVVATESADSNDFMNDNYLDAQQWHKMLRMEGNGSGRNIATGNKIIENDKSKYQIMQLRSSKLPLAEWLFATNIDNEKERRNPLFSPWGGKRNSNLYKPDPKIRRPSRVPFNSWGGKRDGEKYNFDDKIKDVKRLHTVNSPGIKKPFNSWGGKRTPVIVEYLVNLPSSDVLKNTWQSTYLTSINEQIKQDSRNGDKKNDNINLEEKEMRIAFEPWGKTKRDVDSNENDYTFSSAQTLLHSQ